MQKKIILRLGIVGVVATASGSSAFAVGCSSDDSTGTGPVADSGPADSTGFVDSPTGTDAAHDSAADTAPPPPPNAKLTLVHAAPGVPAFRVCFGLVNAGATIVAPGYEPLPNAAAHQGPFPYLGIFPGTGGTLADLGVNYANLEIVGFIINAEKIATITDAMGSTEPDCSDLIGGDGTGAADAGPNALVLGTDYFQLPPIPKGTLTANSSFILALEGCEPRNYAQSAPVICGSSYQADAGNGNIALELYAVDNKSTPAAGSLGIQVLHASSAWDGILTVTPPAAPPATGGYGQPFSNYFVVGDTADGGDAGVPFASQINFGAPVTPDAAASQAVNPADYANLYVAIGATAPDGGLLAFPDPAVDGGVVYGNPPATQVFFPEIQALSGFATLADGGPAGPLYLPGANYVAIWVGDPSQPEFINGLGQPVTDGGASSFNTAYPHFLMFPTDPVLPASN